MGEKLVFVSIILAYIFLMIFVGIMAYLDR